MYIVDSGAKYIEKQELDSAIARAKELSQDGRKVAVYIPDGRLNLVYRRGEMVSFRDDRASRPHPKDRAKAS